MHRRLAVMAIALMAVVPTVRSAPPDVVEVDGGQVFGATDNGVHVFKGIPFAAAPIGGLRWKPPQPVVPWQGVREAKTFSAECMQTPYPETSAYFRPAMALSEDCLYLNVWSAAAPGDKRPVMVWIHGGAWTRGAGWIAVYEALALG